MPESKDAKRKELVKLGRPDLAESELVELPSATVEAIKCLDKVGVHTFELMTILDELDAERSGLNATAYYSIKKQAQEEVPYLIDFKPSKDVERQFISTGSVKFDELLGGGYLIGEIMELSGNFATGKSTSGLTAFVTAYQAFKAPGLMIHTEWQQPISRDRVLEIAKTRGVDYPFDEAFIKVQAMSTDVQEESVMRADSWVKKSGCKLIVVDGLLTLYRAEYSSTSGLDAESALGVLARRQQAIGRHLRQLARLAAMFKLAVIVTTPLQADPSAKGTYKPAGGATAHLNVGKIVEFQRVNAKGSGTGWDAVSLSTEDKARTKGMREVTLIKSLDRPVDSRVIRITERGIDDVSSKAEGDGEDEEEDEQ